jgi:hypothetical protein
MYKSFVTLFAAALLSTAAMSQDAQSNGAASAPIAEGTAPSGSVTLSGGAVAAGVGYVWGHGHLDYDGKPHRFNLKGISVVDVGAAGITATGEVYNLNNLQDFDGNYAAVSAGATIAGGGSVAYLKNEHGVVIKLHSTTVGLRFTLSADGVHIKLRKK